MAYLALFDILGFKQAILNEPLEDLKEALGESFNKELDVSVSFKNPGMQKPEEVDTLDHHLNHAEPHCEYIRFSDTILIYSGDTEFDLLHIILAANRMIAFMILKGLPIRGALTRGELFVDKDNTLVIGEGLIRAYELEQIQQWAGGILDPERIKIPNDIFETNRTNVFYMDIVLESRQMMLYPAPFKTKGRKRKPVWCLG